VERAKHTFRNGKSQAQQIAASISAHGNSRHTAKQAGEKGLVHGLGTERGLKQSLAQYAEWLHSRRRGDLRTSTREAITDYLHERAEQVGQSALNMDRQHLDRLQRHLHGQDVEPLPKVRSELETIRSTRAYTPAQLDAIRAAQTDRHALTTELAQRTGIRAHCAASIRPAAEQPRSARRQWSDARFTGPGGLLPPGSLYTVVGKGGLVREIWIPADLVPRLEARRLPMPERVTDRGVHYIRAYDIGYGQSWSQSFTAASKRALGWSNGAHGARHTYVQTRVSELQEAGWSYKDARLVVSQEVGHFRESVIDAYLR